MFVCTWHVYIVSLSYCMPSAKLHNFLLQGNKLIRWDCLHVSTTCDSDLIGHPVKALLGPGIYIIYIIIIILHHIGMIIQFISQHECVISFN